MKEFKLAEKSNQPNAIVRFYRETVGELRKVAWPTREETWNLTLIVLIVLVAMSAFLGAIDSGGAWLLNQVLGM
ncbi:MAG: preprotein translocase subunit SecE [Chloroflexi bacterium]|nr:MAG: preprotein translocase subunit SecE [Chloroflexota bacterium]